MAGGDMKLKSAALSLVTSIFTAACAPKPPETIIVNPSEISFPKTYSVVLNDHVIPPGGIVDRTTSGWTVHGTMDGITWRYGSNEHFLLVASRPGVDWSDLDETKEWTLSCALMDGSAMQCSFSQVAYVGDTVHGLTIHDRVVCLSGGSFLGSGDLILDGGETHRSSQHPACFGSAESAGVLQSLLATHSFIVQAPQANSGTTFSTYGLKQALSLNDWIRDRYEAGELETKEGL
jgi:hypothetical protein